MSTQWSYNPFTYLFCSTENGAILGEMPLSGVGFGKILNGNGQLQGAFDLNDPNIQQLTPMDLTTPEETMVFVDYNGSLVWGGLISTRAYDFQAGKRTVTVTATDAWDYFGQRIQATDYSSPPFSGITGPSTPMSIWNAANVTVGGVATAWDPVLMAWQIISDALSLNTPYSNIMGGLSIAANGFTTTGGYIGSVSGTPSSAYVSESYPFSSLQTIDTMVNQLTQLGYTVGPDRGFDVAYSNGPLSVPVGTVNLSYPRRGRAYTANNLVCDLRAARSYSFPEDGTQEANTIYETGTSGCIVALQNIFPIEQLIPWLERSIGRSQINSAAIQNLLYQIGLSDLYLYSYPVVAPQVTVGLFDGNPMLGSFIEGDDILLKIPQFDYTNENVWDPRFPNGLYQPWRIQQWQATVGDDGDSTLQLTLNQPPAVSTIGPPI